MFDLALAAEQAQRFTAEVPAADEAWQIGLIVGPSGSGKTTIARQHWPAAYAAARAWPRRPRRGRRLCRGPDQGHHRHADRRGLQFPAALDQALPRALQRRALPLRPGTGDPRGRRAGGLRRVHQRRGPHRRPHRVGRGGQGDPPHGPPLRGRFPAITTLPNGSNRIGCWTCRAARCNGGGFGDRPSAWTFIDRRLLHGPCLRSITI